MSAAPLPDDDWLAQLDFEAVADPDDKLSECEFFFGLMSAEVDRERFRWLASAFLNAAYSFFESSALMAFLRFTDKEGEPIADHHALDVLGRYVNVERRGRRRDFVKTTPLHPLTEQLYQFRRKTTHHYSLSVMIAGPSLPADFHFGSTRRQGVPVIKLCGDVIELVRRVQQEIDE